MKGREKKESRKRNGSDSHYSKGVAMLVFLMLAIQFVFFTGYIIKSYLRIGDDDSIVEVVPEQSAGEKKSGAVGKTTPVRTVFEQKSSAEDVSAVKMYEEKTVERGMSVQKDIVRETVAEKVPETVPPQDNTWKWDRVELNSADSAALVDLPGIGPYYARKILYYRSRLWGCFADKRQLMEITGIDSAMYRKFEDRIYVEPSSISYIDLYNMSEDSLAKHPYIGYYAAKGIAALRRLVPENEFTVDTLISSKILTEEQAGRLCRYIKK